MIYRAGQLCGVAKKARADGFSKDLMTFFSLQFRSFSSFGQMHSSVMGDGQLFRLLSKSLLHFFLLICSCAVAKSVFFII